MKTLGALLITITIFSNLNTQFGDSHDCQIEGVKNSDISKSSRNITQRVEGTVITLRTAQTIAVQGSDKLLESL